MQPYTIDSASNHTRTMLHLFLATAPNLISENSTKEIARNIAHSIAGIKYNSFWPFGKVNTEHLIADFFVTGDNDLLELKKIEKTKILTIKELTEKL